MHLSGPDGLVDDACYHKCPPPVPSQGRGIFIITRLPGVTLRSPPAVYWRPYFLRSTSEGAFAGLTHAVDFPALRAWAHLSTPDGAVDEWIRGSGSGYFLPSSGRICGVSPSFVGRPAS